MTMNQMALEAVKKRARPYLLVSDRGGPFHVKLHDSMSKVKGAMQHESRYDYTTTSEGGAYPRIMFEVIIFEWSGSEWTELYHIEAGTLLEDMPWKSPKGIAK